MHAALRWFKIAKLLTYRVNMAQIHALSAEQRLAQWVIYAVLAAPIVATLLRDLGVGAGRPMDPLRNHCSTDDCNAISS